MFFSLVAMTGLEKCCITSAYLQWLCHSGERPVTHGPLVVNLCQWQGITQSFALLLLQSEVDGKDDYITFIHQCEMCTYPPFFTI